jgi:hypothetical protein
LKAGSYHLPPISSLLGTMFLSTHTPFASRRLSDHEIPCLFFMCGTITERSIRRRTWKM